MATIFLSIGTNLGERRKNISKAIKLLKKSVGRCVKISDLYISKAWGFESENEFMNVAAEFETSLQPLELLKTTQQIEHLLGRIDKTQNVEYSDRIIDIDILFYNNQIIDLPHLTIPHPLLHKRNFVLIPLAEIAPELQHPVLNKSIKQLAKELQKSN
ncbi:MAG: 2-amino-4-hydroxy-6-hydroxymethyldihydropteridine diphosphokinase [Paludibacter sp.]|nr:2-amino-4-hydroxy-6-hydroxymethyldihydropteridine diphosphokinase [Paludibacter sp.]